VLLAAIVLVPFAVLVVGWARGETFRGLRVVAIALVALWVGAGVAFVTGANNADGAVDCWPQCTVYQDGVRISFVFTLPVLAGCALLAFFFDAVSERRRAARRPG
jgi:hypothetical protein